MRDQVQDRQGRRRRFRLTIGVLGLLVIGIVLGVGQGGVRPAVAQEGGAVTPTPTATDLPTLTPPVRLTPTVTPTQAPLAALPEFGVFEPRCGAGIEPLTADFAGSGVIVTTLSRDAMWIIDLDRVTRYPLPETKPCGPNCQPAPDRTQLLYVEPSLGTYWLMRVDGTQRRPAFAYYVSEMGWWNNDTWLVWPTADQPALFDMETEEAVRRFQYDVFAVQPGGYYGLLLSPIDSDYPLLQLVDMETDAVTDLALVKPYLGGAYWAPDGAQLAFIGQGARDPALDQYGAELYAVTPGENEIRQLTNLTAQYGAVRIAGQLEARAVSWSPSGRYLAFWVMEIVGPDPVTDVGQGVIHVLDVQTGRTVVYCGFGSDLSPLLVPGLVWSPDGQYLAFGVDVPGDERAALLLALDTVSGTFTELTEGVYAAYGTYDPVMWGYNLNN